MFGISITSDNKRHIKLTEEAGPFSEIDSTFWVATLPGCPQPNGGHLTRCELTAGCALTGCVLHNHFLSGLVG